MPFGFPTPATYSPTTVYYGIEQLRQMYIYLKLESQEPYHVDIINAVNAAMADLEPVLIAYDTQWGTY